jgi:tetratricopeptide (TPR) repeat protein
MARAAVKAKQQAKAKAQPPKTAHGRGRRRHSGGGNPNQQLFFMRLRRGQKWLYALLAVVFAATFAGVGVGSGAGGGLSDLYTGLFGGNGSSVSKAKGEIKDHPAKGYRDLATAYETNGDTAQAISALQSYLGVRKNDANAWSELGGLEFSQAQTYAGQFQAAQQAAQLADPSQPFQPGGTLAQAIGTNPAYQGAAQQASSQTAVLSQQTQAAVSAAVSDYKKAASLHPRQAAGWELLATTAENGGDYKTALQAWNRWYKLSPNSPQRKQIKAHIKQLEKALAPAKSSSAGTSSKSKK